tara:strand:+ start:98 stop:412 length:315 start_codon:yes stop_codon:yes gene_type:complete
VGVGIVTGESQPASEFLLTTEQGEQPAMDVLSVGTYHREWINDEEKCEYFVPVKWLSTIKTSEAVQEVGMFGNQNTICKPTTSKWRSTVDRLKTHFPQWNQIDK